MNEDARGLAPLDELDDMEVAEGYTDIRGFEAYLPDGRKIGEVDELLVDTGARRVAAITLDLDDDGPDIGREPHPRVAIEHVEIDTPSRRVLITSTGVGGLGLAGSTAAAGTARGGLFEDTTRGTAGAAEQRMTPVQEELDVRRERMAAGSADVRDHAMVEADLRRERAGVTETGDVRRVDGMRADEGLRANEGLDLHHPLRGGRDLDGDGVR